MSVLVTGGGSGLGADAARHFAARGARVAIAGRRAERVEAVAREIGPACVAVVGDVTSAADRARMRDAALAHGGRLDALVCAAGNMLRAPIEALDERAVLDLFHTNVVGHMALVGASVDALAAARGAVVFFGSVHTRRAFPGASAYAATKGALESITRVLAAELGPRGIRVSCVVPGAVPSEINVRAGLATDAENRARLEGMAAMHALGRIGSGAEVAEAVEHLVCAEWTTGAVLEVDGGLGLGVTRA
ncbi:MAG: SDR family oxidoreductase [Deltaproteobacteria bacterium]|nr:SDR family oxidoreductase [Deltaproteobacteria bacterium]